MDGLEPIEPHQRVLEMFKGQHFAINPALATHPIVTDQGRVVFRLEVVKCIPVYESRRNLEQTGLERVAVVLFAAFEGSVDEDRVGHRCGHGFSVFGSRHHHLASS